MRLKKDHLLLGVLLATAAGAWLAPPPWPLGDPEARFALQARGLLLGRPEALGEPVPVVGALLGLFLAGDSDFAVRLPGMLTGAALAALAWGLAPELGRPRALALGLLWTFSPVLALAGRTVGPAAWVNLLTALGAFGLVRWAGTGRQGFLFLGILSAVLLLGCGPAGWTALGGLGAAGALSRLAARPAPAPAAGAALPALAAGASLLGLGFGTFGLPAPAADFPQPPLPVPVLLAVYEPLALGAWLTGLPKLRSDLRSGWASALGVVWSLTGLAGLLLPVPADPLARLGPASLAFGLGASGPFGEVLGRPLGRVGSWAVLGVVLLGAAGGFTGLTVLGALGSASAGSLDINSRLMLAAASACTTPALAALWLYRDPAGRRLLLLAGLVILGGLSVHQFWRTNYGLGPELIGPVRPGPDLGLLVRKAEEMAGRPVARQGVDLTAAPPSLRWALRTLAGGAGPTLRPEPGGPGPILATVRLPVAYPEFNGTRQFLRWLFYREYDRLRTVDFVLKGEGG